MKKIKKFNLNQSHFLSSEEMSKLYGRVYLHDKCDSTNEGEPCLYGSDGAHYTGTCEYMDYSWTSEGLQITVSGYVCVKS
jgi:hypothetical protein